jgi:hypothetical protein
MRTAVDGDVESTGDHLLDALDDIRVFPEVDCLGAGFLSRELETFRHAIDDDYARGAFQKREPHGALPDWTKALR